jgi:hypothetical protein
MEEQYRLKFPFEELIHHKGIYFMLEATFNECLEGKFVFIGKDNRMIQKISPKRSEHFRHFIERADISFKHKNGFVIFKKV